MSWKPRMPVVYVAGPFRCASQAMPGQQDSWGIHLNVVAAMKVAREVWAMGAAAVCPHANTFCFQNTLSDATWLEGDLAILSVCHALVTVPGWERSEGAKAEVRFAEEHGIPVFDLTHLPRWVEEWSVREGERCA